MSGAGRRLAHEVHSCVHGRLDQLEDRLSGTQEAGGSNPPASTLTPIAKSVATWDATFPRQPDYKLIP